MTFSIEISNVVKNYKYFETAFLPHTITIPLKLEDDTSYNPCVKVGDLVEEGQVIAVNSKKVNLHSSVPGKVLDIVPCYCSNGKQYFGIKIEFGGKFSYTGKKLREFQPQEITPNLVADKLISYGIFNTFNLAKIKNLGLEIKEAKKFNNLVVRLFDEDNYRYTDSLIAKFLMDKLMIAAKTLASAISAQGIIFAFNNKSENKEDLLKLQDERIHVIGMNIKRYPCGTEREIMSAYIRNQSIKKTDKFKISKKDLYIDSSTLYEVYKAINTDMPQLSRPVFVYGNCLKASTILDVKLGTTIKDLVKQIGGFVKEPKLIVINGLISGSRVQSLDTPITKDVKSLTFLSKEKKTDQNIFNCINCGNCRFICPVKISPDLIYNNVIYYKELTQNIALSSIRCTNCGLCNINCPSRLPLCQTIMYLKNSLLNDDSAKFTSESKNSSTSFDPKQDSETQED
ncbi:MAG: hypothetical protein K5866_01140 [Treponema sp.]|nr:hypothetical protein [Treponema sp.]